MQTQNMRPSSTLFKDNTEQKEDIIDLLKIFRSLLKHWFLIIAGSLFCGGLVYLGCSYLITPTYASTSQLYVLNKSTDDDSTSVSDIQKGSSLTNDYIVVVTDRPVLEQVKKQLQLDLTYKQMVQKITVVNPANSRLLNITVKDHDPKLAKKFTDKLADVVSQFIAEKMKQDPPSVTSYGYTDDRPVSPNKKKNSIIGAIIGFILISFIVVLKELSHDVVMTQADVEEKLGLYMLSSIPYDEKLPNKKNRRPKKNK